MREFINKYSFPLIAILLLAAGAIVFFHFRNNSAPPPPFAGDASLAFFVDENTGHESILPADQIPPLAGADGKDSLVIAIKAKADSEPAPKICYLIKYPTEVRDRALALPANHLDRLNMLEANRWVRAPEPGSPWLATTDPAAEKIVLVPDESPNHPRRIVFPLKPH